MSRKRGKKGPGNRKERQERGKKEKRSKTPPRSEADQPSSSGPVAGAIGLTPSRILLLATGFGIWVGVIEVVPVFLAPFGGVVVRLSRHFIWMTPLANLMFFLLAALVLLGLSKVWERAGARPVVMGVMAGLATLAMGLVLERLYPPAVGLLAVGVGVQVSRWTGKPVRRPRVLWAFVAIGLAVVLGVTAHLEMRNRAFHRYWDAWLPAAPTGAPNIVLLILDTVRGSSLDFLGNVGPSSPWEPVRPPVLTGLANRSVLFTRAMAPSPWTLPSHASMFTGRWANGLSQLTHRGSEWYRALDPRNPVLAEVLARNGYQTAGFVGNLVFTSSETGLARGFETYRDYEVSLPQILLSSAIGRRLAGSDLLRRVFRYQEVLNRKDARTVTDEFLEWHEENGERPFFAFLNFFDAHEPHLPPDSVKESMPPGSRWNDFSHFSGLLTGATALRNRKWEMDPAEQHAHAAGYHEAILRMDREIGRMMEELEARGALDNTIVIISSDHGEQLGEHGLYNHNNSLYLPVLYVPLLVVDPVSEPGPTEVTDVVSLRNIAATVLDLAGVDGEPAGIQGRSLTRYWKHAGQPDTGIAESDLGTSFAVLYRGAENEPWYPLEKGPSMYAVTDSAYHYILGGDGTEELFDLEADPGEMVNLAGEPEMGSVLLDIRAKLRNLAPELDGAGLLRDER